MFRKVTRLSVGVSSPQTSLLIQNRTLFGLIKDKNTRAVEVVKVNSKNYKNFVHKKDEPPLVVKFVAFFGLGSLLGISFFHTQIYDFMSAASSPALAPNENSEETVVEVEEGKKKKKKEKVGFRDRKVDEFNK